MATAVALAVLWVGSGITTSVAFPPNSVAGALVRETPGDVATFFIELLGHWALRLATLGALAAALALGAEALVRVRSGEALRPYLAGGVLGGLAALGALVEPSAEVSPVWMGLTLLTAALAYGLVASLLLRTENAGAGGEPAATSVIPSAGVDPAEPIVHETGLTRRSLLKIGAGGALALAVGGGVIGWILRRAGGPDRNVALVAPETPATIPARGPFPDIAGLTPEITSVADHYQVDVNLVQPTVEAEGWTLSVAGAVEQPLEFSFESLQQEFEVVEEYSVLACISNPVGGPLVGHSAWRGVRLKDVLAAAGSRPGAMDVVFKGADGYTDSIPMEVAVDPSVILAVAQNGEPLTREHGFPCRVRVPRIYGMKNVKWLQAIEVVETDYKGYWMKRGWSDSAVIKTQSRIDVAGEDGEATVGTETWIAGIAWAGDRGVDGVEVSVDGGDLWEQAQLKDPVSDLSWRLWAYRWTPERAGSVKVMCRATDGAGEVQAAERTEPHPAGAAGYHALEVEVA